MQDLTKSSSCYPRTEGGMKFFPEANKGASGAGMFDIRGALLAKAVNGWAVSLQGDSTFPSASLLPGHHFPLVPSAPCSSPSFQSPLALSLTQQLLRPSQAQRLRLSSTQSIRYCVP